jgi:post-segregation antitoxin (ccd killing protein)
MGSQVTVTSKIPSELKERLNRLGINISGLIREALKSEAERLERERLQKLAEEAGEILQKIPDRELIEAIRIGRKAR